jgi:pimeloyl-ACP methyl ester carboxylesterase
MARPRIMLLPFTTELEWPIREALSEWADVAAFDAPGVGDEPPRGGIGPETVVDRALEELERRGWSDCVVAADEFVVPVAIDLAARAPERVAGLALGHPTCAYTMEGDGCTINGEVMSAFVQIGRLDYRSYLRSLTQLTQGAYDDDFVEEYIRRVPREVDSAYVGQISRVMGDSGDIAARLEELDKPMLLVEHDGCLAFTKEGWDEIRARFPDAVTASTTVKPSTSREFATALREFCSELSFA